MSKRRGVTTPELTVVEDELRLPQFFRRFFIFDLRLPLHLLRLWQNAYLLYALTLRGVRARYKQSVVGIGWAVITPAAMTAVFTYLFVRTRLNEAVPFPCPFPVYALCMLTFWTFFQRAVANGSTALVTNMDLVTKVYFPREVLPISSVLTNLVDWAVAFVMFVLAAFAHSRLVPRVAGHFPSWKRYAETSDYVFGPHVAWLWVPLLFAALVLFAMGVVFFVSALQVYFRDMSHLVNLGLFLWMFLTPVLYPLDAVAGGRATTLIILNPVTGILDGIRLALLNGRSPWEHHVIYGAGCSLILFVAGYSFFKHEERYFADVV
jgi:lipopolysaccharide transport system permease protein